MSRRSHPPIARSNDPPGAQEGGNRAAAPGSIDMPAADSEAELQRRVSETKQFLLCVPRERSSD